MITPAPGKVLVSMHELRHSQIALPESFSMPNLSVAEIVSNGKKGIKVLVPTKAGLDIKQGDKRYRLVNESDIVAEIHED